MLSEFIQFKLIKSQPQLSKTINLNLVDTKYSLQFQKNPLNSKVQSAESYPSHHHFNQNKNIKISDQNKRKTKFKIISQCPYQQNTFQYFPFTRNSKSKKPLILSSKKLSLVGKYETSLSKKIPLIQSKIQKHSIQQNEKIFLLGGSKNWKENTNQKIIIQKNLIKSSQIAFNQTPQNKESYLFRSTTQQSLSPLRQKLTLIKRNTGYQKNIRKSLSTKRYLQRSDSFKSAIQKSLQKRKLIKQNMQPNSNLQKQNLIQNEYYMKLDQNGKDHKNSKVDKYSKIDKKSLQVSKKTYFFKQNIIKEPKKNSEKSKQIQNIHLCFNSEQYLEKKKQDIRKPMNQVEKKVDSFIQDSVNNSNLLQFLQGQQSAINMNPF